MCRCSTAAGTACSTRASCALAAVPATLCLRGSGGCHQRMKRQSWRTIGNSGGSTLLLHRLLWHLTVSVWSAPRRASYALALAVSSCVQSERCRLYVSLYAAASGTHMRRTMPRERSAGKRLPRRCSAVTPSASNGTAMFRTAARVPAAPASRLPCGRPSTSHVHAGSAPVPSLRTDAKLRLACERHRAVKVKGFLLHVSGFRCACRNACMACQTAAGRQT